MLMALVMLGLLPLAAMPVLNPAESEADDDTGEASDAGGDTGDDGGILDLFGEPDTSEIDLYQFDAAPGGKVIQDFEPGTDLVEMDLTSVQGDLFFDMNEGPEGAAVSFSVGPQDVSTLFFEGLDEVPVADIHLTMSDPGTGELYEMSLSEALEEEAGLPPDDPADDGVVDPDGEGPDSPVILPDDPDVPDMPGGVTPDGPVILPDDPDAPDMPGGVAGDSPVIGPNDPDAPDFPSPLVAASAEAAAQSGEVTMDTGAEQTAPEVAARPGEVGEQLCCDDEKSGASGAGAIGPDDTEGPDVVLDPGTDPEPDPGNDPSLVLDPNDPDAPDTPSPVDPESPAVGPNDPDAPDPVPPATGDSPAVPPDDPDAVSPGPGNPGPGGQTVMSEGGEEAAKGAKADMPMQPELERVDIDQAGVETADGVIDIADFRVGEDVLSIELEGDSDDAAEIAVQPSEDGADGLVVMDGEVIAILRGAPAATELDVRLITGAKAA